jgi:hypothetical protein
VRRRLASLAASAVTATLALFGAAWAATGALPVVGGVQVRAPLAVAAQATGPLVANDRDGRAILSAAALRPGVPATGEVTVSNAGDAPGAFTLSSGGAPGALAGVLDLVVRDVTSGAGTTLYTGKLAAFARLPLGTLTAGTARRYRFEVAYPAGRTALADDALQGATTSVAFTWDTVAIAPPTTPSTPTPPVTVPAQGTPSAPAPSVPGGSGSGSGSGASARRPATPAGSGVAVPATPGSTAAAGTLKLALGAASKRPVAKGRLSVWMTSTAVTTARVSGTVTVARKRYRLKTTTVRLTAKRKVVRLRLPRQAAGRGKRLTVKLTIAGGSGRTRVTLRRTLRVRAR